LQAEPRQARRIEISVVQWKEHAWAWEPAKLGFACFLAESLGKLISLILSFFIYKRELIRQFEDYVKCL